MHVLEYFTVLWWKLMLEHDKCASSAHMYM